MMEFCFKVHLELTKLWESWERFKKQDNNIRDVPD